MRGDERRWEEMRGDGMRGDEIKISLGISCLDQTALGLTAAEYNSCLETIVLNWSEATWQHCCGQIGATRLR